ncbi:ATP-binding cassette domain-containing protein [Ohtaekwangia koreensis]|uniref:Molybdate transport system ATP-binding protein n=1 Tax=Ohtaekwangia koreensis TaxID=688867 RepID=A0A1T5JNL8_9BACT|nr:ATP-binding cassette domain-containing protein [Ohtaekwangia koreensis]SKC53127.1 molybdate transport system ATP-binding protein [Ohtaekwangia koreensis]
MIELRNVNVVKVGKKLFENFTWSIKANEHWVITGANGSGKTLLLELLAGHSHATQGEVAYDFVTGATWDERFAQRKQNIHYIPAHAIQAFLQQHELFYQQRYYSIGDERIPLVRDLFGEDIERLHVLDFPESFNIDALLNIEVTRLSNGQLKKVLILKNLVRELPKVLLFDYPFEGLDHASRADLIAFMDHLTKAYSIQLILVDHEHHLPAAINRKLVLDNFKIDAVQDVVYTSMPAIKQELYSDNEKSGTPVVEMRDVTIRYGERDIIRNLNWKIYPGERWALTGRNGSGKTTLFSLIFADHPMAYSQHVYLFGKRRGSGESIWDIKNRINYLGPELISYLNPQHITMSAQEYIVSQKQNTDRKALEDIALYFEAHSFLSKPVKNLSSGQLQLMLIMIGLLSDKELLLLDEPFQFLDTVNKERVNRYLQEHLQASTTLVLITHYEQDIARWTKQRLHL